MLMARAYSNDLRHKLLSAYDKGQGNLSELALRFGVSRGWAWKISAHRRRTGSSDLPAYTHGSKSRVDEKALTGLLRARAT
jgi:transposase